MKTVKFYLMFVVVVCRGECGQRRKVDKTIRKMSDLLEDYVQTPLKKN